MGRAVGIDFGTTNSVICALEGGEPVVIPNQRGERLTPSVVAFGEEGELLVGTAAKNQSVINCERTFRSIKRKLGENFKVNIDGREYAAAQIAAIIIGRLKESAEEFLGEPITEAIITVPAYFNDGQRQAVKLAGELAGLEVKRLINEPTAAALAFGMPRNQEGTILVFDLGGGTFDVSVLDISGTVYEALATRGNNKLGGDDFDARVVHHIVSDFYQKHRIDLREDPMAMQKARDAAESAKKELSESASASIHVPFISADREGPKHLQMTLTRQKFEELVADYLDEIDGLVSAALEDAGMSLRDIGAVALVGGSSRIPAVRRRLEEKFGNKLIRSSNPDESVAVGACIQAGVMSGGVKGLVLVDITPLTLGIETDNDVFVPIIERNSCIPTTRGRVFTTVTDGQTSVEVHVLQGERAQASRNFSLGRFTLEGIPPAPRGVPRIDVVFDIDVNGIAHVRAQNEETGEHREIRIEAGNAVDEEDIRKMALDAAAHKDEDELFIARNRLLRQARALLSRINEKAEREGLESLNDNPEIEELVDYIKSALGGGDIHQLKTAVETMSVYLNELAAV